MNTPRPQSAPSLLQQLQAKGISMRTAAARLGVDRAHLRRVLTGQRPGSEALLQSVAHLAQTSRGRRPQEDVARLIGAAVHLFFVKRGKFQSEVWTPPVPRNPAEEDRA